MQLIKVNAINSTNSLALQKLRENPKMEPCCIWAQQQWEGRGQRGSQWISRAGQNLTFSIVFPYPNVPVDRQFLISASVATAIIKSLKKQEVPKLKVKWPNDIMAANFKIGGILIENVIVKEKLAATVIGIGLNVNQTHFENLPLAGSLKLATGRNFNREEILHGLMHEIEHALSNISLLVSEEIMNTYKKYLFRIHVPSTFQLPDKSLFTGIIHDISENGKLIVEMENEFLKEFDLKEIKMMI